MTDNGVAALAAALVRADYLSPNGYPSAASFAAAILGPRGVFLPDGLGPVMVGMAKEIAALRDALVKVEHIVAAWEADDIWEMNEAMPALRAALAAAKVSP